MLIRIPHFLIAAAVLTVSPMAAFSFEVLPESAPIPDANPQTPAKIELGKKLFFDKRVSADNSVSCNTCHNVLGSGTDNLPTSTGIKGQFGPRNSPTVWNAAFLSVQFWDGRAASLEDQAKGPIVNPIEMGMKDHNTVITKIKSIPGYVTAFAEVFGGEDALNIDNLAAAIASYERTLITPDAPVDRFINGDKGALSAKAQAGMELFQELGCIGCHQGPAYAGPQLPIGQGWYQKFPTHTNNIYTKSYSFQDDKGRMEATGIETDRSLFRVPTLRNVALTAPYFHNGMVKELPEAVRIMAKVQLDEDLDNEQIGKIVAFLEGLTGVRPTQTAPVLP